MVQNSPREPNLIKSSHLNVLEMKITFFIKIAFQPFILNKYFSGEKSKDNLLKFFFSPSTHLKLSAGGSTPVSSPDNGVSPVVCAFIGQT